MDWKKDGYTVSTDKAWLNIDIIHRFLSESYWARGIPRQTVELSIEHSLCFGAYKQGELVGFARVISDQATFAYLSDVFVLPDYRGLGLSKWMMSCILALPSLQGLRKILLATSDAHSLYSRFGFKQPEKPEVFMEISVPDIYQ